MTIQQANEAMLQWVNTTAGQRIHGNVKEQSVAYFKKVELMSIPYP